MTIVAAGSSEDAARRFEDLQNGEEGARTPKDGERPLHGLGESGGWCG